MTKEHRTAIIVAIITLAVMVFVTFFRSGTSW
jgi:hypothetical protein